ncbi:MAG: DUF2141 domain-containing protein [Treponema sp.]|nr:DUF2141 domain-containing protein [Treponema sp.]
MLRIILKRAASVSKLPVFILFLLLYYAINLHADNVQFTVEITNVTVNNGKVYLAIFSNADEFRRETPFIAFELESNRTVLLQEVSLPPGNYLISAFQDANGNQKLDTNFIGIPRELVGLSNYDGNGFPSRSFDRHKIPINSATNMITIRLHRF